MTVTYCVTLQPDGTIDWGTAGPPAVPVPTIISVVLEPTAEVQRHLFKTKLRLPDETNEELEARQERLRVALNRIAELNPFRDIADPVEWQREQRRDRLLPGREE